MRSKLVAQLLADLGVTKTHSPASTEVLACGEKPSTSAARRRACEAVDDGRCGRAPSGSATASAWREVIDLRLPCILSAIRLYFDAEQLERARVAGWFTFEIREHVGQPNERNK